MCVHHAPTIWPASIISTPSTKMHQAGPASRSSPIRVQSLPKRQPNPFPSPKWSKTKSFFTFLDRKNWTPKKMNPSAVNPLSAPWHRNPVSGSLHCTTSCPGQSSSRRGATGRWGDVSTELPEDYKNHSPLVPWYIYIYCIYILHIYIIYSIVYVSLIIYYMSTV